MKRFKVSILFIAILSAFAIVLTGCGGGGGDMFSFCPEGSIEAVNDSSKCCFSNYPYYWASDGKCHTTSPDGGGGGGGGGCVPTGCGTLWYSSCTGGCYSHSDCMATLTYAYGCSSGGSCRQCP